MYMYVCTRLPTEMNGYIFFFLEMLSYSQCSSLDLSLPVLFLAESKYLFVVCMQDLALWAS